MEECQGINSKDTLTMMAIVGVASPSRGIYSGALLFLATPELKD